MSNVKDFTNKTNKIYHLAEKLESEVDNKTSALNTIAEIKELSSNLEIPQMKCISCISYINKNTGENNCELKCMPKKIKKDSNGAFVFGCMYHSDY